MLVQHDTCVAVETISHAAIVIGVVRRVCVQGACGERAERRGE